MILIGEVRFLLSNWVRLETDSDMAGGYRQVASETDNFRWRTGLSYSI